MGEAAADTETLFTHECADSAAPPITVVVPLYNYAGFVLETLDSVARQTMSGLDLVVVDDRSTDDSAAVACRWMESNQARFRRATVLRNLVNSRLAKTRNTGFANAVTDFVFPLDADNTLYPTCLEKLHRALTASPAAFSYCMLERFLTPDGEEPEPHVMNIHPWRPETLASGNKIDAMVLLRRSIWEKVGGYTLTMPCQGWEDYDLWFKIARAGGYGLQVPQILARYRVHRNSMLHTETNATKNVPQLLSYLRTSYPEFYEPPDAA